MKLNELTTPFERCRVIHYGKSGNKAVKHWFDVQHIIGALYKTADRTNEYGEPEFDLILRYEGMKDGLRYSHGNTYRDWLTTDILADAMSRIGYDTLENFISTMNDNVSKGVFIGNAEIEFIRQIDPQRAETYAEYRSAYYAAKEEQYQKEQLAVLEKERLEKERQEAENQAEREKLCGWADTMSNMRFGKVMKTLNKLIRNEDKVMPKYEFIKWAVQNNWLPKQCDNVRTRSGRTKTEYCLTKNNISYVVSKTEYDFGVFLAEKYVGNKR